MKAKETCGTVRCRETVNHGQALTKSLPGTSFMTLRGHLSRPACSHVKQLAKQAGDRSDPGRTFVQAGFFIGLILSMDLPLRRPVPI